MKENFGKSQNLNKRNFCEFFQYQ